jgi:hypothetical protein
MRRKDTSRACAFSAAVTVFGPRVRPPLLMSRFVDGDAKELLDSVGRAALGSAAREEVYC